MAKNLPLQLTVISGRRPGNLKRWFSFFTPLEFMFSLQIEHFHVNMEWKISFFCISDFNYTLSCLVTWSKYYLRPKLLIFVQRLRNAWEHEQRRSFLRLTTRAPSGFNKNFTTRGLSGFLKNYDKGTFRFEEKFYDKGTFRFLDKLRQGNFQVFWKNKTRGPSGFNKSFTTRGLSGF